MALAAPSALLAQTPPLRVALHAPLGSKQLLEQGHGPQRGVIRHPWPVRDRSAELAAAAAEEATSGGNTFTKDGVEVEISLARDEVSQSTSEISVFVGLYSFSLTGSEATVEDWLISTGVPPPENPLRLSTMFLYQHTGGAVQPDELGDVCLGETFRAEICARVSTCFRAKLETGGLHRWHVALPMQWACEYRVEVFLGEPDAACRPYSHLGAAEAEVASEWTPWWAPPVGDHAVPLLTMRATLATSERFRLLHVNQASWWWASNAGVEPATCWMELMGAAVRAAADSAAAEPAAYGLPAPASAPRGLWLEFGVGSGKTTAYIARLMTATVPEATLHGFDSFQGLPTSWAHTKLPAGTFSRGGAIPEHLADMPNVEVHVGLFAQTLPDLDRHGQAPVAFAHVDVDLYSSAVEVLSHIACQLIPGSVLVFDELVNYVGFELSGEYRAWSYVTGRYGISWEYAGPFWQQAVPVVITGRGSRC